MTGGRYLIFIRWRDVGLESTGHVIEARSGDEAVSSAGRQGIAAGLGRLPLYEGLESRRVPGTLDRDRHPLLWEHFTRQTAWAEGLGSGEWVGRAADGVTVSFGTVGDEDAVERYLTSHPTPAFW